MASKTETPGGEVTQYDPGFKHGSLTQRETPLDTSSIKGKVDFQVGGVGGVSGSVISFPNGGAGRLFPPGIWATQYGTTTVEVRVNGPSPVGAASTFDGAVGTGPLVSELIASMTWISAGVYDVLFNWAFIAFGPTDNILTIVQLNGIGTAVRSIAIPTGVSTVRISLFNAAGLPADGGFQAFFFTPTNG